MHTAPCPAQLYTLPTAPLPHSLLAPGLLELGSRLYPCQSSHTPGCTGRGDNGCQPVAPDGTALGTCGAAGCMMPVTGLDSRYGGAWGGSVLSSGASLQRRYCFLFTAPKHCQHLNLPPCSASNHLWGALCPLGTPLLTPQPSEPSFAGQGQRSEVAGLS